MEEIKQGGEDQASIDARRTKWQARDKDLANTPLRMADVERILKTLVSDEVIATAKRAREK